MMSLSERFAECRGLGTRAIEEAFANEDLDAITGAIVHEFGWRTDRSLLPSLPYMVRHTMYGEADVSEWCLAYREDGFDLEAEVPSGAWQMDVRWERWEDAVRLLNGDISALSLLYSRRVSVGDVSIEAPAWFTAVDFAPNSLAAKHTTLLSGLTTAARGGSRELEEFVSSTGIRDIAEARAVVVARALVESGSASELAGSYMRIFIPMEPALRLQIDFDSETAMPNLSSQLQEEAGENEKGVTLRYESPAAMISAATGEVTFAQMLVKGMVKIDGAEDSVERFGMALMRFAQLFDS